jgi:ribonuclease-3
MQQEPNGRGHRFQDASLLRAALTHRSFLHEHPDEPGPDFERLEFLGDAVVDLVVGEEMYRRFPSATEGELTALRAQVVSSSALAAVSLRLGLPDQARLGRGEEDTGGRGRAGLAASLFESLVGAIYLDSGLEDARAVVLGSLAPEIEATTRGPRKTAKSLLQEWAQAERYPLPVYRMVEERGPEHRRDFLIEVEVAGRVAQGAGPSKREAQEVAAAKLLDEVAR